MLADGALKEYPKPADVVFRLDHPVIAPIDMDIIKITAQFAARNGNKFLQGLLSRESRNPQFEFIKPDHFLYSYFQSLVESYQKVLLLPADEKEKIVLFASDRQAIIDRIMNRYMYESQMERRQMERDKLESETKESVSRIDWFNFTIVETLAFPIDESVALGLPLDPRTGRTILTGELPLPMGESGRPFPENEEEIEMDTPLVDSPVVDSALAPLPIRTDYVRVKKSLVADQFLSSPVTGELVRESDFSEHMRVVLLDPKWKEQSEKVLKRAREEASALAEDIGENISGFIQRRLEIFGTHTSAQAAAAKTPASIGPSLPLQTEQPPAKRRLPR